MRALPRQARARTQRCNGLGHVQTSRFHAEKSNCLIPDSLSFFRNRLANGARAGCSHARPFHLPGNAATALNIII